MYQYYIVYYSIYRNNPGAKIAICVKKWTVFHQKDEGIGKKGHFLKEKNGLKKMVTKNLDFDK